MLDYLKQSSFHQSCGKTYMTPIIYEYVDFFPFDKRYHSAVIAPDTILWRLIHNHSNGRKPLLAMNTVAIQFDSYWHQIDMARSQTICPTLEVMGIKSGQTIRLHGEQIALDQLDCRAVNMFEFTRLGSMTSHQTSNKSSEQRLGGWDHQGIIVAPRSPIPSETRSNPGGWPDQFRGSVCG